MVRAVDLISKLRGQTNSYQVNLPRHQCPGISAPYRAFTFRPPDGTVYCIIKETFKVIYLPTYTDVHHFMIIVLTGDSMVGYHIGLYQMHPYRSSCLNLTENGSMG